MTRWDWLLWVSGGCFLLAAIVFVSGYWLAYQSRRRELRGELHPAGEPDPFDVARKYRSRAIIEEAQYREAWLRDPANKGLTPPWEKPPVPKNAPKPKADPPKDDAA